MNDNEIEQQKDLLSAHRSTLAVLLRQQAFLSVGYTPPGVINGISEARAAIRHIKAELMRQGVPVEHAPDDEVALTSRLVANSLPIPRQLRAPAADFIGRIDEIARLVEALNQAVTAGKPGIVAIRGMAGAGKTELAYAVAMHIADQFPDAQLLVDLRGTSNPPLTSEQALQTVIRAFLSQEQVADERIMLEGQYRALLAGQRAIVVADDARDSAQVRALIPPAGSVLIITSRNRFTVAGMVTVDVAGLRIAEAQFLLRDICPRVGTYAHSLAELSGCLPLALRVSASLLASDTTLRIERYLARLANERTRLQVLRDPDDLDLDVAASLRLSYQALDDAAQMALRQCAVFASDFDLAAAEAVLALPGEIVVEEVLSMLYRRSLLEYDPVSERYSLHDLVRAYAATQLDPTENTAVHTRHASHYMEIAVQARAAMESADQRAWFSRVAANYSQMRAALQWKISEDIEQAAALCRMLWPFWRIHGHIAEARQWLTVLLSRREDLTSQTQCQILYWAANLMLAHGNATEANQQCTEMLSLAQQLQSPELTMRALGMAGVIARIQSDYPRAQACFEQKLEIAQSEGDRQSQAGAIFELGLMARQQKDYPRAIRLTQECCSLSKSIGDYNLIVSSLHQLGWIAADQMDYATARDCFENCLEMSRAHQHTRDIAACYHSLGRVAFLMGSNDQAVAWFAQSLELAREIGDHGRIADLLCNMGQVQLIQGNESQAIVLADESAHYYAVEGHQRGHASSLRLRGDIALRKGQPRSALRHYIEALLLLRTSEAGDLQRAGETITRLGTACAQIGAYLSAARILSMSAAIRAATSVLLSMRELAEYDQALDIVQRELGEVIFAAAWETGRALRMEEIIAETQRIAEYTHISGDAPQ